MSAWVRVALVLAVAVAAFLGGYHVASLGAQRDAAKVQVSQSDGAVQVLQGQAAQSLANEQSAAQQTAARKAAEQKADIEYRTITKTVTKYVQAHPDLDSCGLDGDGLRAWREANAGHAMPASASEPGR